MRLAGLPPKQVEGRLAVVAVVAVTTAVMAGVVGAVAHAEA